jgi:phospho-N-acetylmuramoyl-pentapeptide-transferase
VIVGGILAFLWFNIPPARFYMSETGSMALTVTITVIAFLTNHVLLLLVIAFPLIATSMSNVVQLIYKRIFGRKLLQIAPIHHHFEAIGWPAYKVTMRYWIISIFCAILGTVLALVA